MHGISNRIHPSYEISSTIYILIQYLPPLMEFPVLFNPPPLIHGISGLKMPFSMECPGLKNAPFSVEIALEKNILKKISSMEILNSEVSQQRGGPD